MKKLIPFIHLAYHSLSFIRNQFFFFKNTYTFNNFNFSTIYKLINEIMLKLKYLEYINILVINITY